MCPGCGGPDSQGSGSAARCFGWSGPDGEEFALDKSASAGAEAPAELLTAIVGGTSRRNVLGAIASKRTLATSRSEATTTESEPDDQTTVRAQQSSRLTNPRNKRRSPGATVTKPPRGKPLLLDKLFQEGHIDEWCAHSQQARSWKGDRQTRPRVLCWVAGYHPSRYGGPTMYP